MKEAAKDTGEGGAGPGVGFLCLFGRSYKEVLALTCQDVLAVLLGYSTVTCQVETLCVINRPFSVLMLTTTGTFFRYSGATLVVTQ